MTQVSLGERIKKIRLNNQLTVRQLAEKVGVSASFIYQLEQNKVSPSFSTLKSLAQVLNTNISLLVEEDLPEEWLVVRRQNRKKVVTDNPGLSLELLTFLGAREKRMQPFIFRLEAGAVYDGFKMFSAEREDFFYVLSGSLEICLPEKSYLLDTGDAAYFIFDHPVLLKNPGQSTAEVFWIISPPI